MCPSSDDASVATDHSLEVSPEGDDRSVLNHQPEVLLSLSVGHGRIVTLPPQLHCAQLNLQSENLRAGGTARHPECPFENSSELLPLVGSLLAETLHFGSGENSQTDTEWFIR
jgi:hypothetical protein